ncbi:isopentenyl transferase family protein [Brevibacillus daliensis]|uniref:isopentenyl transferase family protein n=1 Tax=Brevibacillus daliensis TaxID=2892995 RepID=UPI001E632743|nr:isopentenyl transferase family protein [Brevibacillus daliensis]
MQVYALFGPSGTGKSSSALKVAKEREIDAIIDDGILIYEGHKVAGYSAKYEKTKIRAVKRAIFLFPEHAEEVKGILSKLPIKRLLVLGTSTRMIRRIVEALELPDVVEFIPIESIKPQKEIEAARYIRETMGQHTIPIPRVEVEKDLFKRIVDSAWQMFSTKKAGLGDTTVVQPSFSGGHIQIHEQVLRKLVQQTCLRHSVVAKVNKVLYGFESLPTLQITLTLQANLGEKLRPQLVELQHQLQQDLEYFLFIAPASIDIYVSGIKING